MKVFWDTNLFIYYIERHSVFGPQVLALYRQCRSKGCQLLTSSLTLGEVLAQPLRAGRGDLLLEYRNLLRDSGTFSVVNFTESAADLYARIRADMRLRQPDAIQVACALDAGARVLVTNGKDLWHPGIFASLIIQGIDSPLPSD
jgi:predicted nucleic acid-binding protein